MPDAQNLIAILVIGLVAGWLAHLIMGFGTLGRDLVSGLLGAVVGSLIIIGFGVPLPFESPTVNDIVISTIGAVVVIVISRVLTWRSRDKVDAL
jgi:uncharacterized membrane protein YeaQ/YmgE (transglycosylase-associated protein family)